MISCFLSWKSMVSPISSSKKSNPALAPLGFPPLSMAHPLTSSKQNIKIRKGCPLSPFLYILVVNSLSRKLQRLLLKGTILGLSYSSGSQPINHALFADDSILLGNPSLQIARNFNLSLDLFLCTSESRQTLTNVGYTTGTTMPRPLEIYPRS